MNDNTRTYANSSDDQLNEAIAAFEEARDAGATPNPLDWLNRYPDVADRLREYFVNAQNLRGLTRQPLDGAPLPDSGAFADYDILELISSGGMGVVYKARRKSTHQIVALKLIRPELVQGLSPEHRRKILERFVTEAQVAALLEHENIVKVYDVGERSGHPYYSMRYVQGKSLSGLIQDGLVPPKQAAAYIEQVARAVHLAHQHGIIHRDLKPNNILVDAQSDRPLVSDFGLAKLIDRNQDLTETRDIMGAPPYMSPEQAQNSALVTTATDVYGLGATLYALLTGRPPFHGETPVATLKKVLEEEPTPPRKLNSAVPRDLETICLKCLEKDPAKRYASAMKFAEDLESWREGLPISARPSGSVERAWRWCRRNRRVAILLVCVAMSMLGGTAFSTYFAFEANRLAGIAAENETKAKVETVKALRRSYVSDLRLIERSWADSQFERMRELLESQRPSQTNELDLRSFEWHYWRRLAQPQRSFRVAQSTLGLLTAFTPDSRFLARAHFNSDHSLISDIQVWDTKTEELKVVLNVAPDLIHALAISNDGGTVALASFNASELWNVGANKKTLTLSDHRGQAFAMVFSPTGNRLAIASAVWDPPEADYARGEVKIWDVTTGKVIATLPEFVDPVLCMAFSGEDKLATGTGRLLSEEKLLRKETGKLTFQPALVQVWNTDTGKLRCEFKGHNAAVTHVAFDPEGKRLLSADRDRFLKLWALETRQEIYSVKNEVPAKSVCYLAFHPNGKSFAVAEEPLPGPADRPGLIKVCHMLTGEEIYSLRGHDHPINNLVFHPSGQYLSSIDDAGVVNSWHLVKNRETMALPGSAKSHSYDSKAARLTILDGDTLKVWDLQTGMEVVATKISDDFKKSPVELAIGCNGRYLAALIGRNVIIWDANLGKRLHTFKLSAIYQDIITGGSIHYSPGGQRLVFNTGTAATIWDLSSGRELLTVKAPKLADFKSFQFSDDEKKLGATFSVGLPNAEQPGATFSSRLHLWDLETAREMAVGPSGLVDWKFSADSQRVHGVFRSTNRFTACILDTNTGAELTTFPMQDSSDTLFSPDGRYFVCAGPNSNRVVWDFATGTKLLQTPGESSQFDPTCEYLAVRLGGHKTRVLHLKTGREVCTFYHLRVRGVQMSPDGKRLVSYGPLADTDSQGFSTWELKLWDLLTGQEVTAFRTPEKTQWSSVFFTPDGNRLVVSMNRKTAIWDGTPKE